MNIEFWTPVFLSLKIGLLATFIVMILGIVIGKGMSGKTFRGKSVVETLFLLPLVLPPSVLGFLLIVVFGRNSPVGSMIEWMFDQPIMFTWWAGLVAAVVVSFPLMYQSAKAGFEGVDSGAEEAAKVDGAGEWQVLFYVSLPLALRFILSGGILSFARALGEFGATLMFAGNIPGKTQTISTAIYMAIDSGRMNDAWLWVFLMMALSFIMIFLVQVWKK